MSKETSSQYVRYALSGIAPPLTRLGRHMIRPPSMATSDGLLMKNVRMYDTFVHHSYSHMNY